MAWDSSKVYTGGLAPPGWKLAAHSAASGMGGRGGLATAWTTSGH